MRSVVVVFPASMCAMMPIFRMRSSGVVRGIASFTQQKCGATKRPRAGRSRTAVIRGHRPQDAGSLGSGSRGCRSKRLPPVMREGAVRLRHPVRVLFLLDRLALALRGEDLLGRQALGHVLLPAGA